MRLARYWNKLGYDWAESDTGLLGAEVLWSKRAFLIPFFQPQLSTPYLLKYPALPKQSELDLQIFFKKETSRTFSTIEEYSTCNKRS
jgi:hypothetical protein